MLATEHRFHGIRVLYTFHEDTGFWSAVAVWCEHMRELDINVKPMPRSLCEEWAEAVCLLAVSVPPEMQPPPQMH